MLEDGLLSGPLKFIVVHFCLGSAHFALRKALGVIVKLQVCLDEALREITEQSERDTSEYMERPDALGSVPSPAKEDPRQTVDATIPKMQKPAQCIRECHLPTELPVGTRDPLRADRISVKFLDTTLSPSIFRTFHSIFVGKGTVRQLGLNIGRYDEKRELLYCGIRVEPQPHTYHLIDKEGNISSKVRIEEKMSDRVTSKITIRNPASKEKEPNSFKKAVFKVSLRVK